jgi:transcriptional regulator with XRE-family HTH domain
MMLGVLMAKKRRVPIVHDPVVRLFADRLRSVRVARGMTQAELGQQAQVTATYVSRLESAKAAPGIDLVARLAAALGTTVTDLMPAAAPPDPLPVLKAQAQRLLAALLQTGDGEAFQQLNPFLALLVEAVGKRRPG